MSIATEITRLQGAKADLKTAIENKGVTVSSSALLDTYASLVDSIPTGTSPAPVGGIIFYIDPRSDETVEFYDASGSVLSNVAVGDSPATYKVTDYGINGLPKYYVYYNHLYGNGAGTDGPRQWTYHDGTSYIKEETGATITLVGGGKINSTIVMQARNGAYANDPYPIWHALKDARDNELAGCSDWFIGSKDELEQLRLFQVANAGTGSITDFFTNKELHSSSEKSSNFDFMWYQSSWSNSDKSSGRCWCYIRSM